jgi:hypothetical protein
MKTQSIIAAAILSITGAAFAQGEATYEYPQALTVAKSRAEVLAELQQARAAGQIVSGETYVQPQATIVAEKSRSEVRTLAVASSQALPPNVEAISFDGRSLAQRAAPATAPVVASVSR